MDTPARRIAISVLAMALVVVALLAFRTAGQDEEDQRTAARESTQSQPSEEASGGTLQGGTRNDGGAQPGGDRAQPTARLTLRDGEVVGGRQTIEVRVGEEVTLALTSDVSDEVHVHGLDRYADLEAGRTEELSFTAETEGVFVVEAHDAGTLLAELEVSS
ncbi:MAG TPA: hypothetical protein VGV40_01310 [Solirubrobacteraceae bacterium]|nr:hypothetical protein [Solirubrobacteraceae bacterium]